jgi:hypothetical protein
VEHIGEISPKKCKYTWIHVEVDEWLKKQANNLRAVGFSASTAGASKILIDNVLKPNNIDLSKTIMFKPVKIGYKRQKL